LLSACGFCRLGDFFFVVFVFVFVLGFAGRLWQSRNATVATMTAAAEVAFLESGCTYAHSSPHRIHVVTEYGFCE
jgi:hypothetical protein